MWSTSSPMSSAMAARNGSLHLLVARLRGRGSRRSGLHRGRNRRLGCLNGLVPGDRNHDLAQDHNNEVIRQISAMNTVIRPIRTTLGILGSGILLYLPSP